MELQRGTPEYFESLNSNAVLRNRYDPDEAEARVRNLIADTERMLAGLSSLSGNKPQKPSEGVSV